jgi:predicted RNA-binding protein YlxR (DUF448 family)
MTRGGTKTLRPDGAERRCIASGTVAPRSGLIRFVAGPDGAVVPDLAGKLPGRGLYVAPDRAALTRAAAKGLFSRAAKAPLKAPEDLADQVERLLVRRVIDLISLARKSGMAVAGYEKVKDWLARDDAAVLIQAEDGSARGKSKLSTPYGGDYIGWLTADELGMAFGRQNVIHAALGAGGLAQRVVEDARRLKGIRVGTSGPTRGGTGHRKGRRPE